MTKKATAALLLAVTASLLAGAGAVRIAESVFRDGASSFTMVPPTFSGNRILVQTFDEPADGFAANLNVHVQPAIPLADFLAHTEAQFQQMGLTVEKVEEIELRGRPALRVAYHGKMQNVDLAFLCITLFGEDHNYVGTGACLAKSRDRYFPAFERSLRTMTLAD